MIAMGTAKELERTEAKIQDSHPVPKPRKWKKLRNIFGGVLVSTAFAATMVLLADKESGKLYLYKQGKIGIEELSLGDKIEAWKFELSRGGKCRPNYAGVIADLQEEQFRLMHLNNEADSKRLSQIREVFIETQLSIIKMFPECKKETHK